MTNFEQNRYSQQAHTNKQYQKLKYIPAWFFSCLKIWKLSNTFVINIGNKNNTHIICLLRKEIWYRFAKPFFAVSDSLSFSPKYQMATNAYTTKKGKTTFVSFPTLTRIGSVTLSQNMLENLSKNHNKISGLF